MLETYTGYWSPYALLFTIFMTFISLALVVVLIIFALMGRISTRLVPHEELVPEPEGDENDGTAPSMDKALKRSQKAALRKAQQRGGRENSPKKPRRRTGWQYLLGAIACSPVSVFVFGWIDNPLGRMQGLTFGAVVSFLLLAAQIFLTVRFSLCQRRLSR